jgi:methionine sulfoxide reductase heme-binding subunit
LSANTHRAQLAFHVLGAMPIAWLIAQIVQGNLGADPVRELTHQTGWWALVFLLATLSMTPIRRLSGQGGWITFRRPLGLWCFTFASLHLAVFIMLDLAFRWSEIANAIAEQPFILLGFCAWLLLVPLALTSNHFMMRKLGRNWQRLHKLVYIIGALACLHFYSQAKTITLEPLLFGASFLLLMLLRLPRIARLFTRRR